MSDNKELIAIEDEQLLEMFTSDDGIKPVIELARELVKNFEHDLSTEAGRKRTNSFAYKFSRFKTKADALGKSLTDDWAKKKSAVDKNRKALRDAIDELKIEARRPLTELEAEEAAEKARLAEIERLKQVEADHEIALLLNEKFDAERAAAAEAERIAEEDRLAKLKAEQEEREKRIAAEAAERERQAAIEREKEIKRQAEEAEKKAREAEVRARIQAEEAEKRRIEAEKQAKIQAEQAAEQARLAEIARQEAEARRIADEQAERERNKRHIGEVRKAAKESIMALGIDEETAKKLVLAIHNKKIANVTINY